MNVPFAIAAALSLVAAAIHGSAGEALIVRKLRTETLSPTPFGGPVMTKLMIRVTWHIVTLAFLITGSAMALCSPAASSSACEGVGRMSAVSYGGFAMLTIGLGVVASGRRLPRMLLKHPGPLVFVAVAILAWRGSLA
jgi:hypothetical protein